VKLHLPHDLADASIHASTTTGKIRLVSNGRTESYTKTFTRSGISAFIIQASTVNGNVLLSELAGRKLTKRMDWIKCFSLVD